MKDDDFYDRKVQKADRVFDLVLLWTLILGLLWFLFAFVR
jgi:hypothetical protein